MGTVITQEGWGTVITCEHRHRRMGHSYYMWAQTQEDGAQLLHVSTDTGGWGTVITCEHRHRRMGHSYYMWAQTQEDGAQLLHVSTDTGGWGHSYYMWAQTQEDGAQLLHVSTDTGGWGTVITCSLRLSPFDSRGLAVESPSRLTEARVNKLELRVSCCAL